MCQNLKTYYFITNSAFSFKEIDRVVSWIFINSPSIWDWNRVPCFRNSLIVFVWKHRTPFNNSGFLKSINIPNSNIALLFNRGTITTSNSPSCSNALGVKLTPYPNSLEFEIKIKNGYIYASAKDGLKGSKIKFPSISVGATENAILAAVQAKGKTIINNCSFCS